MIDLDEQRVERALEFAALEELEPEALEWLRQTLRAQGRSLEDELAALRASNAQILATYPRHDLNPQAPPMTSRDPEASWTRWRRVKRHARLAMAPAALVACALLAWAWWAPVAPVSAPDERVQDIERAKGAQLEAPALKIWRLSEDGPQRLEDGALVRAGEQLQVQAMAPARERYGAIFSVDGRGVVTQHWPAPPAQRAGVMPRGELTLETSYTLDDAPEFERFYLFLEADASSLARYRAWLAQAPLHDAPESLKATLTLRKP